MSVYPEAADTADTSHQDSNDVQESAADATITR